MRLDSIVPDTEAGRQEATAIRSALTSALAEIRVPPADCRCPTSSSSAWPISWSGRSKGTGATPTPRSRSTSLAPRASRSTSRRRPASIASCRRRSNAARHAPDAPVAISVTVDPDAVRAQARDRGPGFDPASALRIRPDGGEGLAGLRDRAESIGAQLEITAAPGAGTILVLTLPRKRV